MNLEYFDIHTHTQFSAFDADRDEAMKRSADAGVGMIVVGTQRDTSKNGIELAEKYENVWATVGLHPIHTDKSFHDSDELGGGETAKEFSSRGEVFDYGYYKKLAENRKVVAVGECGLDYYRLSPESVKKQKNAFEQQIALANEVGKPLMLHIRNAVRDGRTDSFGDAYKDAYEMVKSLAKVKGDIHFYAGDWNTAKKFLDLGFAISFTGVITFARNYDEIIRKAPLGMIMSETDAPYVAPEPHRGKRNEPCYVIEIVHAISRIRGEEERKIADALMENAKRTFGI